eukprot:2555938-Rhodomonas_salina.1
MQPSHFSQADEERVDDDEADRQREQAETSAVDEEEELASNLPDASVLDLSLSDVPTFSADDEDARREESADTLTALALSVQSQRAPEEATFRSEATQHGSPSQISQELTAVAGSPSARQPASAEEVERRRLELEAEIEWARSPFSLGLRRSSVP